MLIGEVLIKPRRFETYSDDDVEYWKRIYNGKKDLYKTVYLYRDVVDPDTAIIDKIFLDFDYDPSMKFLRDVRVVAEYLYENDYLFSIQFSGNGFHILIYLSDVVLENPKIAIKQYVNFLHKETNTTSDPAVIGDLRRVMRIPNTLNVKHKQRFYCIALKLDELMYMSYEEIREMAKTTREEEIFMNGHRYLDISAWDNIVVDTNNNQEQRIIYDMNIDNNIPPCVKSFMKDPMLGNLGRVQLILFLRDLGYTEEEVENILFSFLSEAKFNHSVYEEKQIEHLFNKDYTFSDCALQKQNGFCTDEKCKGCKLYY